MKKLAFPAIIRKNDDRGFTAEFPDLPGCITFGEDLADVLFMAEDAASGWILDELEDGKTIPTASDPMELNTEKGEFISMMALDIEAYAEKYGSKAVKKNTTIPAFLNTFGENEKLNFSKVLTDALMELYMNKKSE